MRWSRRAVNASLRLLWTLLLVVFSAHHAAPDAPIWHGLTSHAQHGHSSELAFTAVHADHQNHCELCFTSAFSPPATLGGVPRVVFVSFRASGDATRRGLASDQRLPEAHAPPRT